MRRSIIRPRHSEPMLQEARPPFVVVVPPPPHPLVVQHEFFELESLEVLRKAHEQLGIPFSL